MSQFFSFFIFSLFAFIAKGQRSYCDACEEVTISSSGRNRFTSGTNVTTSNCLGGALEHQPHLLGTYTLAGSLWDGLVPYYRSSNNHYLTPDRMSDPLQENRIQWIVSDLPMGFNGGIINRVYTEGVTCPYNIPDMWEYLWDKKWWIDQTLTVTCTKIKSI